LPFRLEIAVHRGTLCDHGLDPVAFDDGKPRRPMPAPAPALYADTLGVDFRPRRQIVERAREHALGPDVDLQGRFARPGHVERKNADTLPQIETGRLHGLLLAA